jgi:hypothetical protein
MNRHTYQKLRHAARRAQRAWWASIKDPYTSNYERGRLNDQMHEEVSKVPGGMGRATNEVMLEGWFWRRMAVNRRITDRKAKARIADAIELMSMHSFSQSDWRWAA